jgi:hypothetical protein
MGATLGVAWVKVAVALMVPMWCGSHHRSSGLSTHLDKSEVPVYFVVVARC